MLITDFEKKQFIEFAVKQVKDHKAKAKLMTEAEEYFKGRNVAIMERKKLMAMPLRGSDGTIKSTIQVEDPYRANNTLPSNFFRPIVKQKVSTLINSDMSIENETVKETLGKQFTHKLKTLGETASQKVYAAWQVFVQDGQFKLKLVASENTIFIDDPIDEDVYHMVIRYHETEKNKKKITVIKVYDAQNVAIIEDEKLVSIEAHGVTTLGFDTDVEQEAINWGMPPFVRLKNNYECISDLEPIKAMIDIYDIVNSDFANNLEDFQEMFWVLKNFQGQNIDEYFDQVKRFKAIKVGEDGDAKLESQEVPVEARKQFLQLTEENIYKFAMAVNTNNMAMGDITNVVLKSLYANLFLKVDDFESEVEVALDYLLTLLNKYYEFTDQPQIDKLGIKFDRSMVFNEIELATLANESQGALSDKTRLANDPRVTNVEEEIEQIKQERADQVALLGGGMDFDSDSDE